MLDKSHHPKPIMTTCYRFLATEASAPRDADRRLAAGRQARARRGGVVPEAQTTLTGEERVPRNVEEDFGDGRHVCVVVWEASADLLGVFIYRDGWRRAVRHLRASNVTGASPIYDVIIVRQSRSPGRCKHPRSQSKSLPCLPVCMQIRMTSYCACAWS